ncbi:MAG: hypothetical protein V3T61_02515 [Acidobacteriota bacterium]
MQHNFATKVTGWSFILAAWMLLSGWILLPVHIGTFFQPGDFSAIHEQWSFWVWMYRVHLFGMVVTVIALVALGSLLSQTEARVLVWPGVAVASAGMMVSALAAAFYYHFGAWGAIDMEGQSADAIRGFVNSLRVDTEYITCLVRFGRVFYGLGLLVVGFGLLKWKGLPVWLAWSAVVLGAAGMGLTMGLPDDLELYLPVFCLNVLWLGTTGFVMLWFQLSPAEGDAS